MDDGYVAELMTKDGVLYMVSAFHCVASSFAVRKSNFALRVAALVLSSVAEKPDSQYATLDSQAASC